MSAAFHGSLPGRSADRHDRLGRFRDAGDAGEFAARPGGAPANVAVALRRLGVPSAFCGAVGDDPFGTRLRRVLIADHVDTGSLKVVPGESTTLAFAWKNERGDGHFRLVRLADVLLSELDVEQAAISESGGDHRRFGRADGIAFPRRDLPRSRVGLRGRRAGLLRRQHAAKPLGVGRAGPGDLPAGSGPDDNSQTERGRCGRALRPARSRTQIFAAQVGSDAVRLLTDGARGAWFRNELGGVEHVPAFPIEPVEPTGAGDAFMAAVVSRILVSQRAPSRADIEFASAAGAITATRIGAIESLPTRAEIDQFLISR